MAITAVCTSCGKKFQAPDQFGGKRVKCKGCGTVFQIPGESARTAGAARAGENTAGRSGSKTHVDLNAASRSGDGVGNDALAALESVASFSGEEIHTPKPRTPVQVGNEGSRAGSKGGGARIGPRLEDTKMASNPDASEIALDGPTDTVYRVNLMRFRYPGAKQVDQWLPLTLLLLGLGLVGLLASRQDTKGVAWIGMLRFLIPLGLYYVLIFPMTLGMIRKAGAELKYQMPPGDKLRGFAAYMPAFAFTVAFWLAGGGGWFGLALGLVLGLAVSSAALWLLFRLREEELPSSVGYGAGGFVLGAGISIAIVVGLNLMAGIVVTQFKAQAKIPASPFGPGLRWVGTTSDAPAGKGPIKGGLPPAPLNAETPKPTFASPVLANLQTSPIAVPGSPSEVNNNLIQPMGGGQVIAVVKSDKGQIAVEPWNVVTGERLNGEYRTQTRPARFVLSPDGGKLAWIGTFPRRSIQIWSFDAGKLSRIDLDTARGDAELIGFSAPDRLLLRWGSDPSTPEIEVLNIEAQSSVCHFKTVKLESAHPILAICPATQRLVVASRIKRVPTLVQYDLNDGQAFQYTRISQLDPALDVDPKGLAYSNDGKRLGVYIEHEGSALLVSYDADGATKPVDLVYPEGATPGVTHENFLAGNALASLDPSPCWLVYGDAVIDARSNDVLANIGVKNIIAQRVLEGDRLQLLTTDAANQLHLTVATLDRAKLQNLVNPPATQPSAGAITAVRN